MGSRLTTDVFLEKRGNKIEIHLNGRRRRRFALGLILPTLFVAASFVFPSYVTLGPPPMKFVLLGLLILLIPLFVIETRSAELDLETRTFRHGRDVFSFDEIEAFYVRPEIVFTRFGPATRTQLRAFIKSDTGFSEAKARNFEELGKSRSLLLIGGSPEPMREVGHELARLTGVEFHL